MIEHGENHTYDWTLSEREKDLKDALKKEIYRDCTELGCDHREHRLLLKSGEKLTATYKGAEFTTADLVEIFKEHFGITGEELNYFGVTAAITGGSLTNAGDYPNNVTFTLTNGVFLNGEGETSETLSFTIEKFNVENLDKEAIQSSLSGLVYDGTAKTPNLTLQAKGLTGAVSHEAFVWANNTDAGDNTASVTIKGSGDNFTGELTINFSIAKKSITVTVNPQTHEYDGEVPNPTARQVADWTTEDGAICGSDELGISFTLEGGAKDVKEGGYKLVGAWTNNNYEIEFTDAVLTVTPRTLTVIVNEGLSHTYGQEVAEIAQAFTLSGYATGEEEALKALISLSTSATKQSAAQTYDITVNYTGTGNALSNYTVDVTGAEGAYTVTKAPVTVTVKAQTFTYDRTEHSYDDKEDGAWTADGLQNNEEKSVLGVTITGSGTEAKTYAVTCSYNTNGNYKVTFEGDTVALVIEKAEITEVTVTSSHTYDGNLYTPTLTVMAGSLTLKDGEYTVEYSGDKYVNEVKDAGTYTVTVTAKSTNFKDQATKVTGTFTIEKAKVTVTADDQSTPEGEDVLSGVNLTWKVTDGRFFNNDEEEVGSNIEVKTNAASERADTTFEIEIGWKEGYTCKNYEATFKKGTYHIVDAIFKGVKITGQTVDYNGESHNITVTIPNEDIKDKATISITLKNGGEPFSGATDAGTYSLHVNIKADGYSTEYNLDVTLTINQIKVTVKFDDKSSTYGDAVVTELTYEMPEGVLEKDQDTFKAAIHPTTNATSKSGVDGKYTITAEKPVLTNYDVTIADGVYTIHARHVEVTVQKQTVKYNQQLQSASSAEAHWSVEGLAEGDEASVLKISLTPTTA